MEDPSDGKSKSSPKNFRICNDYIVIQTNVVVIASFKMIHFFK